MNKIKKYDSSATPSQLQTDYGPATAGVQWDVVDDRLEVNPDGTQRSFSGVLSGTAAPTTEKAGRGGIYVRTSNNTAYVNTGTYASPNWVLIT